MNNVTEKLQVFFEKPFWVGVFERIEDNKVSVCKVTFGAEPKDYEIQKFIIENYYKLRFSPTVECMTVEKMRINPKRMQREVNKQIQTAEIGTKSQQALKLQHELGRIEHKVNSRKRREEEQMRLFLLKQEKKKEKHRGR